MKLRLLATTTLAALFLLGGCDNAAKTREETTSAKPQAATQDAASTVRFHGSDVSQEDIGGDFTLRSVDGDVALSDFRGKVVVLAFGYTHCPDVCPTNLLSLSKVMKALGDDADKVQVIFVSVDPKRDSPETLAGYVKTWNPNFIGLTDNADNPADLMVAKQLYRIVSQEVPGSSPERYMVDHSAGMYILNQEGQTVLYEPYGMRESALVADIRALLAAAH